MQFILQYIIPWLKGYAKTNFESVFIYYYLYINTVFITILNDILLIHIFTFY